MLRGKEAVFECPECLGGLPVPRSSAEIVGGDGRDVIKGKARVVNAAGQDVTAAFLRGARRTAEIVRKAGAAHAILKSKSPSCGISCIRRGSRTVRGCGVTAALLMQNGIKVQEV